jgi:class 3 adenylate cyclase
VTDTLEIQYAKAGDHHLAYATQGSGPVDVLVVGAWFSSLEQTALLRSLGSIDLSAIGRVIRFDAHGTGMSDRIRGHDLPTAEDRVDDMRAVLDAAGCDRALVVAFADAGATCALFAATHPERTFALVLCNTSPRTAWAPDYPWGSTPDEIRRELEDIERDWGTRGYAEQIAREMLPAGAPLDEWLVEWWVKTMRQAAGRGDAVQLSRMYYELDARGVLPTIRVPTLVLSRGGELAEESRAMAHLIPGARHEIMPGTARVVITEHADAYAQAIAGFAAEIADEEAELESILATVLFTDIVGSTARQAELGDVGWQQLIHDHHRIIRGCLARYRGRELDTAGDGFFAAFDGPVRGIRCAQAIVAGVRELGVEVRAGLHTGECRTIDGKVGGLAVSIGARVTGLAGPSEICVSQTVRDLVAGSGLSLVDRGEHELKGVPGAWRVYGVA